MTVLELVDRERARLRRMHLMAGIALAVGATCLLLAVGASALGGYLLGVLIPRLFGF